MTAAAIAKAEASGLMPLDYMLDVLRDPLAEAALRMDAAKAAAPYVHARLTTTDSTIRGTLDIKRLERVVVDTAN
jgi:hypothetical protein